MQCTVNSLLNTNAKRDLRLEPGTFQLQTINQVLQLLSHPDTLEAAEFLQKQ